MKGFLITVLIYALLMIGAVFFAANHAKAWGYHVHHIIHHRHARVHVQVRAAPQRQTPADDSTASYWQAERGQRQPAGRSEANDLAAEAARFVGMSKFTTLPGAWCRDALNVWLKATHYITNASRLALDALHLGPRLSEPVRGAIGVMRRRGGGHVIVVTAVHGNIVEGIGGNGAHRRVADESYPRSRFVAFIEPVKAR